MIYDISHRTTFSYAASVAISQHLLHLSPRPVAHQTTQSHTITVDPPPAVMRDDRDYFDNPITYLSVEEPHRKLSITSTSRIDIGTPQMPNAELSMPWEDVVRASTVQSDREALRAMQFVFDSSYALSNDAAAYAEPSFPAGRPILAGAIDLMRRIFTDFKYEGGVTDISTPVDKVLAERRGVCQDFAHLQIACLRSLGIPARYVSGYLRTHPPEGQERKIGADASHAWLSVWAAHDGWVDLDPTNNLVPGDEHITIAWGRDYGDVSPINGMVLGGAEQKISVAVDVKPLDGELRLYED